MPNNSNRTTNFGPRVSFTTTKADAGPVHVHVPSHGTLEAEGTVTVSGAATFSDTLTSTATIDQSALGSVFLSKQTTASYDSTTLADGELSIGSVSVGSATIYFRSGVTTYEFIADAATLL